MLRSSIEQFRTKHGFVLRRSTPLAPDELRENPGVAGVAFGEPLGFAAQAMQPFEPQPPHPTGGAALLAGEKIDCRADAECGACVQLSIMFGDPKFLLGCAESQDQEIRRGCIYQFNDLRV